MKALKMLNIDSYLVKNDSVGAPIFPDNIVGSISHTDDYCGVALARRSNYKSIGLDIERIGKLDLKMKKIISSEEEFNCASHLLNADRTILVGLIFSSKECFYKLQHTMTRQRLGFKAVEFSVLSGNIFKIKLKQGINDTFYAGRSFLGQYLITETHLFTGMVFQHST